MSVTIDSSHRPRISRARILIPAAILLAILLGARSAISYWVDLLWFRSLSYDQVFWQTLRLQVGTFVLFTLVTFVLLFAGLSALRNAYAGILPTDRQIIVGGQPVTLPLDPALRIATILVAIIVAVISGGSMSSDWPTLALFLYAPGPQSQPADPIFGKSLGFFLFTYPALQLILTWLLTLAVIGCIAAVLLAALSGGVRALERHRLTYGPSPWRGVCLAAVPLFLLLACNFYVSRFELALEHHTIFDGITYTDAHVTLYGLLIVGAALVFAAAFSAYAGLSRPGLRPLVIAALPAVICYGVLTIVGWYVSNFVVKPNELVREQPYIGHNIQMTRQAFGLDRFTQREFPAETTLEAADPANNQATLENIRLWDWHALQDTLRQVQEIRTYYDFPDIDIDRYKINGTLREVMIGTRELNVDKLPESSRNWINEKLIYTHGYGITMNPVNEFTAEGLPNLYLSNMPVQSTVPGLNVAKPQIYFGELTNTDVYVKTRQQEFDYPQGQTNSLTSYEGTGGVPIGGFLRRLLIAFDRDDLGKLPFSDDVNANSRVLIHRNVRERVVMLAPFLSYDQDPYMVLGDDGRLFWIMDAYTSSDSYPYSTHYELDGNSINYMRNSVKVVVDAYNGSTSFYVVDSTDPVLGAYRRMFPSLFKDVSAMPSDLRQHIRYPEKLFRLQAQVYGLYHMTNPAVFFNREDLWTVATETTTGGNGEQIAQPIAPNFVLMKLPGETGTEFVEILPFTPANRNNLIGWIAGRCDGANYGNTIVYDFPKTRLVDGPQQVESRIDQNAQLSGQLTLWNQQGSHVLRGSLLVIPIGKALLYAEPIYLQAQQSPMPELRLVVLALQDKLAYAPTFEAALTSLFGESAAPAQPAAAPQQPNQPQQPQKPSADINALISQASQDFDDYQRLTAQGKLGEAGRKLDELKHVLDQLNGNRK